MTEPAPPIDDDRFARIEALCGVSFAEELRSSLNESVGYWGRELSKPHRYRGPTSQYYRRGQEGFKQTRVGARKRRQYFVMELALHFEIAGGQPKVNGYDRSVGKATGFARFLLEVYDVLPSHARPSSSSTFVRDSDLIAKSVAENRSIVEHYGFPAAGMKTPGGSVARAEYMLRTMTAYRR